jgi:hypothetical protein
LLVKGSPDASAPKGLTPQPPTHPSNAKIRSGKKPR